MIDRAQVERLRKRYPIGSRIELVEMTDDPRPIEPGTTGTLRDIDAAGTPQSRHKTGRGGQER